MKGKEAKAIADGALKELALALDDGQSESLKAFLRVIARFHRYSVGNQLLIALQRPDAERVAGYRAWQRLGRQVRQGERGITILAPIVHRLKGRTGTRLDLVDDDDDEMRRIVRTFKVARVFDVSQTDGKPLPAFASVQGDPSVFLERLEAFVRNRGIQLKRSDTLGRALGVSTGGTILLRSNLAPAQAFSTLTHETAHELLHRDDVGSRVSRTVGETEAEAVAFVVCQAIGLDTNTAASDYIQLYQGDRRLLMASLERIRATAVEIIEAIREDALAKAA